MNPEEYNKKILDTLTTIQRDVAEIKTKISSGVADSPVIGGGGIASDYEMSGEYGDPVVRKDPKRWTGDSYVGCKFSETTPEYLECLAGFKDWSAMKDDETQAVDTKGRPKSHWARKDAKLARGWAARMRSGLVPAPAPREQAQQEEDDSIPF